MDVIYEDEPSIVFGSYVFSRILVSRSFSFLLGPDSSVGTPITRLDSKATQDERTHFLTCVAFVFVN